MFIFTSTLPTLLIFVTTAGLQIQAELQKCSEVEIICKDDENGNYVVLGEILRCFADSSLSVQSRDTAISSVIGVNKSSLSNYSKIKALDIRDAKLKFIPTGIINFFPNLIAIYIQSSGLLAVSKEDFRELGNSFEWLAIHDTNSITYIEADLFLYNPNMRFIYFNGNPLRYIEPDFFKNVKKFERIESISFESVGCMNQKFTNSSQNDIKSFVWKNQGCSDEAARIETQTLLKKSTYLKEKIPEVLEKRLESMDKKLEILTKMVAKLNDAMKYLF